MSFRPGLNKKTDRITRQFHVNLPGLRHVCLCLLLPLVPLMEARAEPGPGMYPAEAGQQSMRVDSWRDGTMAGRTGPEWKVDCASALLRCAAGEPTRFEEADWAGLKRDTWYFMGAQIASLGLLYVLPESVSGWSDEQKDEMGLSKWRKNAGHPVIDEDKFYINYILHPYWGAAYYVRARERGYGRLDSFWYSAFLSTFYEFGPESLFEQPSIQDVIVTPLFGAWLGDYFMGLRRDIERRAEERGYRTGGEDWIWVLTDPLQVIDATMKRLLNRDARFSLSPLIGQDPSRYPLADHDRATTYQQGYFDVDRYRAGIRVTRSIRASTASQLAAFAHRRQDKGLREEQGRMLGLKFDFRF